MNSDNKNKNVLLVGNGFMGKEYIKSLIKLGVDFTVVGNSVKSCVNIVKLFPGIKIISGGLTKFVMGYNNVHCDQFNSCIITTPIQCLEEHLELVLGCGIKNVLVEKPGGLDLKRMKKICKIYTNCNIVLAYNRRFYPSVEKAKKIIEDDGGVQSFTMELTELIHRVDSKKYDPNTLDKWFLSMTTHLTDMAFYLCGDPIKLNALVDRNGQLEWHKETTFCGSGQTDVGALFSYHGDWNSAGRWRLEICTKNNLLIFSPVEQLRIQKKGSMKIDNVELAKYDSCIKMGIFNQTKEFLINPKSDKFLTYHNHCHLVENVYNKMAGY